MLVTVFGGTGFVGRHIVQTLVNQGANVRVAARHIDNTAVPKGVSCVTTDILDVDAVNRAVIGADAVVNAVSLWVEKRGLTFADIHVDGAVRIARAAATTQVRHLIHISGIGVTTESPSAFIRARKQGEEAVAKVFSNTLIVRPSVMFGRNDAFLSGLAQATLAPIVPLFGKGDVLLQPLYIEDMAKGVSALLDTTRKTPDYPEATNSTGIIYEFGGPKVYQYRELVRIICQHLGRKRLLMPVPFPLWRGLAKAMMILPNPPLTVDQIYLLETDNTVNENTYNLSTLGITPAALEDLLSRCLGRE